MPTKTILRKAYDRKAYTRRAYSKSDGTKVKATRIAATHVPATHIPMKGNPKKTGKSPKIITMKKPSILGYHFKDPAEKRHKKLDKDVNEYGYLKTFRDLNAVRTLSKYTSPITHKKADSDIQYIRKKYRS